MLLKLINEETVTQSIITNKLLGKRLVRLKIN